VLVIVEAMELEQLTAVETLVNVLLISIRHFAKCQSCFQSMKVKELVRYLSLQV